MGGGDDADALGEMKIAVDPFAPPEKRQRHFLTLSNRVSETHRVPAAYDMLINPEEQPIHVFSGAREDTAAAAAAAAAAMARAAAVAAASGIPGPVVELPRDDFILEGTVSEKFDVRPADVDDSLYREVSARRIAEATRKTRVVQASKGPSRVAPLPTARNIVKREDGKEDTRERAERMERGALEDKLMGLYERRSLWSFKQLKEETRQPAMFLKETLDGLATLKSPRAERGDVLSEGHVQEERRGRGGGGRRRRGGNLLEIAGGETTRPSDLRKTQKSCVISSSFLLLFGESDERRARVHTLYCIVYVPTSNNHKIYIKSRAVHSCTSRATRASSKTRAMTRCDAIGRGRGRSIDQYIPPFSML